MLTSIFVCTVSIIQPHEVVSSGIIPDEYGDKHSQQFKKEVWKTLEEATQLYMVVIITKSHF